MPCDGAGALGVSGLCRSGAGGGIRDFYEEVLSFARGVFSDVEEMRITQDLLDDLTARAPLVIQIIPCIGCISCPGDIV